MVRKAINPLREIVEEKIRSRSSALTDGRVVGRALGLFARGASHDVGNIAASLRGAAYLAKEDLSRSASEQQAGEVADYLVTEISLASERLEFLCDEMMLFDFDEITMGSGCDVAEIARDVELLMRHLTDAPVVVSGAKEAVVSGMQRSTARAVVFQTISAVSHGAPGGVPVNVEIAISPAGVLFSASGRRLPEKVFEEIDVVELSERNDAALARIRAGLVEVRRAVEHCGGTMETFRNGDMAGILLRFPNPASVSPYAPG